MIAAKFERRLNLKIIRFDSAGITRESLENARRWQDLIKPAFIFLVYQDDPWEFLVYVADRDGNAIRYSGFAWGYGGEGPNGLLTLIRNLGWHAPAPEDWPQAHFPGSWTLYPNGLIQLTAV